MNYPPFLGGYLLSNFIHPVYRLSRTPVSDETPFAGLSPATSASQAYRQLSRPYRLFPNDLRPRLLGRNLSLVATNDLLMRLLGRNLSLVAGDLHLATSLSRDLEVAKQSSSVLQGESPPPPLLHSLGFRHLRSVLLLLQKMFLQTMFLHTLVHIGTVQGHEDVPADDVLAYTGPYRDSPGHEDVPADDVPAYTGPYRDSPGHDPA